VIAGWPCQGHIRAGRGEGLHDPQFHMFWEMLRVLCHLQTKHVRAPAYILKNVPLLGDIRSHVMASVHEIWSWIGPVVLLDAARVSSCAHRPRLWWTNLLPKEVLKRAYKTMSRSSHLIVDSILDIGRRFQVVKVVDRSPMVVVNQVGQPRMALPTFIGFPTSHAYREGGPGLIWDTCSQWLVEPNANERERAMGFLRQ
jgi:site-specific DNA-cytosine methylase